jgi:hypothetical protein
MSTETAAPVAGLIHGKMIEVMRKLGAIAKDQRNDHFNYNFRGIDDVYNAVHGPMAEVGIITTSEIIEKDTQQGATGTGKSKWLVRLRMKYTFTAEDGSSVSTTVEAEGEDANDKAVVKAMANCHKYAIIQMFMIPTKDPKDPENSGIDAAGQEPAHYPNRNQQAPQRQAPQRMSPNTTQGTPPQRQSTGNGPSFQGLAEMLMKSQDDQTRYTIMVEALRDVAQTADDVVRAYTEFTNSKPGHVLKAKVWKVRVAEYTRKGGK